MKRMNTKPVKTNYCRQRKKKMTGKYFMLDWLQPNVPVENLRVIKCPSLIICGDHDLITVEHTVAIYKNIPLAYLWVLPIRRTIRYWNTATNSIKKLTNSSSGPSTYLTNAEPGGFWFRHFCDHKKNSGKSQGDKKTCPLGFFLHVCCNAERMQKDHPE